jgi:hypothetical protein
MASQPFQAFNGPSFTPLNDTQTGAEGITAGVAGYTPQNVTAGQLGNTDLSRYMNPFTQDVIDSTLADVDRNTYKSQENAKGNAAAVGAFGGDRQGIEQAEIAGAGDRTKAITAANLRSQNFGQAQSAATADINRTMAADSANQQAGIAGANLGLNAAGQLFQQGEVGRQAQDQGRQFDYGEFQRQINDPYNKLSWANGIATGAAPLFATQNITATSPGPSQFGQILGGIGSAAAIAGKLGAFSGASGAAGAAGAADGASSVASLAPLALALLANGGVADHPVHAALRRLFADGGEVETAPAADMGGIGIAAAEPVREPVPVQLAALLPDVAARRDALIDAYPQLRVTSEDRGPSRDARVRDSQHTHKRAFDLDIGRVPEEQRPALVRDLTGGRFGAVGGLGMYGDEHPNMLHVDYRDGKRAAWGPNRSHTSLDRTPGYFREAVGEWRGKPVGIQMAAGNNVATDAPAPRPGDPVAVELPRSAPVAADAGIAAATPKYENRAAEQLAALRDNPDEVHWRDPKSGVWDFLLNAGAGMLASRAPGISNVGAGLLAGSNALTQKDIINENRFDRKVSRLTRAADARDTQIERERTRTENSKYHDALLSDRKAERDAADRRAGVDDTRADKELKLREQEARDRAAAAEAERKRREAEDAAPVVEANGHGVVIAEQTTEVMRLTVSEAVMRLDLEHRTVMMFRNSGNGALNVVYRRDDGHVGWIDAP